jgi:hypothetical protein
MEIKKQQMDKYTEINKALMDWNPLSVVGPALSDEYIGLIPSILAQKSELDLENFLKQTLSDQYGVEYEDSDMEGKEEFQLTIKRIADILW